MTIAPLLMVTVGPVTIGGGAPLVLIGGPCAIENEKHALMTAERLAGNPTGAGDAAVAALAAGLVDRRPWPERLADAVALSAAAVAAPLAGSFDPELYQRARRTVAADPWGSAERL